MTQSWLCLASQGGETKNVHWSGIELTRPEINMFFLSFILPSYIARSQSYFWESQDGQQSAVKCLLTMYRNEAIVSKGFCEGWRDG